ncbi:MAG: cobalt ECF transporter T component CbiQ [Clostridiales bacterium]|nr:cobalt ECF transporter T component CbiQ [Clostridiales bacterium]
MLKNVDLYSRHSMARQIHPAEKFVFCVATIIITSSITNYYIILLNIALTTILHIYFKTPFKMVLKFASGILGFSLVSGAIFSLDLGLNFFIIIFLRSLNSSLALTFLIFTTPLEDIFSYLKKFKFLTDTVDIMDMMLRFLYVLEDEINIINLSMKSRGGFLNLKSKIRDTAKMAAVLFINTLKRYFEIKDGMNSRCYTGKHANLKEFKFNLKRVFAIGIYILFLIAMNILI